jgi:Trk-type K+ transport system membrane component
VAGTSTFSQGGRLVLIILMFIGRVGLITLLMAFFRSAAKKYHRYPEGDIYIN